MGPQHRRAREKEALRQDILDAARELFIKEGYENVSMRRIAEKIEYSPTTIYLYFEDKASLLFAICEETFAKLNKRMEAIAKQYEDPLNDNPLKALKEGCRAYIEFGLKYPNHYRLTFMHSPNPELAVKAHLHEGSTGMKAYGCLRAGVEACINQGIFHKTDVESVTQMMWAAGHGITSLLISKPHFPWTNKKQLIELMLNTLIEGLKA